MRKKEEEEEEDEDRTEDIYSDTLGRFGKKCLVIVISLWRKHQVLIPLL